LINEEMDDDFYAEFLMNGLTSLVVIKTNNAVDMIAGIRGFSSITIKMFPYHLCGLFYFTGIGTRDPLLLYRA